jgi:hypothetical protein
MSRPGTALNFPIAGWIIDASGANPIDVNAAEQILEMAVAAHFKSTQSNNQDYRTMWHGFACIMDTPYVVRAFQAGPNPWPG